MEIVVFETLIKMKFKKPEYALSIKNFEKKFIEKIILDIKNFLKTNKIVHKNVNDVKLFDKGDQKSESNSLNPKIKKIILENEKNRLKTKNSLKLLIEKKINEKELKKKENPTVNQMLESKYNLNLKTELKTNELENLKLLPENKVIFLKKNRAETSQEEEEQKQSFLKINKEFDLENTNYSSKKNTNKRQIRQESIRNNPRKTRSGNSKTGRRKEANPFVEVLGK